MQPLSPLERSIAPPARPVRAATGDDAFAALLADIGDSIGEDVRQPPAPPAGKRLPENTPDPALLIAGMLPPVVPMPPPLVEAAAVAPPVRGAAPVPLQPAAPPVGDATPMPVAATPTDASSLAPPPAEPAAPAAMPEGKALPVAVADLPVAPRHRMAGEATAPVVTIAPPAPPPVPLAQAAPLVLADVAQDESDTPEPRETDPLGGWTPLATAEVAPRAVAAPAAGDGARLDMRDDRWMQGMIDHIETLQGEAGTSGETRIRLSPDALGAVEIVLTHGDEGMQVRFASDTPDAGRMIADAQPRLAELAAERGLKLGGMQVDVGARHGGASHDPAPAPRRPREPIAGEPADPIHQDTRIA